MRRMDGLLLLHPTVSAVGYEGAGDFTMDQLGRIAFRDPREVAPFVYAGIQILHPRFFADAPVGRLLAPSALAARHRGRAPLRPAP